MLKLHDILFSYFLWHLVPTRPDRVIGKNYHEAYMHRWYVIPRNPLFNIYLNLTYRSDDSFALHDHPWWNISYLLAGSYVEHTIADGGINLRKTRKAGDLVFRLAKKAHRLELTTGPVLSLFITGPRFRDWGFHCPKQGWRSAKHDIFKNSWSADICD